MANTPKNDPTPSIQPDTIPVPGDAGNQAIELLDKHRNVVMSVAVIAVIAICASLVIRELKRQKQSEAAQAYSAAASERSVEKLDAVVAEYEGSVSAGNALITKADVQLTQEKFEDAKVTLMTFVEKFKDHPRHAQGLYALGNLSHKNGDFEAAAGFYDRALAEDPGGDIGPLILIRLGDIALAQADKLRADGKKEDAEAKLDEARKNYDDAITRPEFRSGPFIEMAEARLALADIGDVPVVPAPPKPEPAPAKKPAEAAPAINDAGKPSAEKPAAAKPGSAAKPAAPDSTPSPTPSDAPDKPKAAPGNGGKNSPKQEKPASTKSPAKPKAPAKNANPAAEKPKANQEAAADGAKGKGKEN